MAFIPQDLSLLVQPIGSTGMRWFSYRTDDSQATLEAADYIPNATRYGVRADDLIFVSQKTSGSAPYTMVVSEIDASDNATLVLGDPLDPDAFLQPANNLSEIASAATARTNLGLGSIATQSASAVAITGGSIAGITDLALADGGTGASTAADARTNLGLGTAAVLTAGDASGNLKALNADGGFTFATTATNLDIAGNFGGSWKSAHRKYSSDTATFAGSRATEAIMREVTGSGTNGPSTSDYGLHVEAWKTSYLTSAVQGEVDGMNIVVRQGELGDAAALLFNAHKVESASYGQTGLEGLMRWVQATTGTVLRDFKVTMGANIPGTDLRSGGAGFTMRSTTGATGGAFNALSDAGTTIARVLTASSSLLAANTYFEITGNGHADGSGLLRAGDGLATKPALTFVGDDDTGLYSASANVLGIATGGTVRMLVGPGVRVGSGLTDPGAGALIATASLHAYAATAIPANGTTGSGIKLSSTSNFGIFFGSGAPTLSAAQGSIYLRSDGSTTSNRIYVNTNGSTTWTAITTAA